MSKQCGRSVGSRSTRRLSSAGACPTVPWGPQRGIAGSARWGAAGGGPSPLAQSQVHGTPARALSRRRARRALACGQHSAPSRRRHGVREQLPREGSAAPAAAITSEQVAPGPAIASRQVPELHPRVAQAQRGVQRVPRPMVGCQAFDAAHDPLVGSARMLMLKQRQRVVEAGDEGRPAAARGYSRAASSLHRQGPLPLHDLLSTMCDTTPAPHRLDHLCIQQPWQRHPARLGQGAFVLASWGLHPVSIVRQQGRHVRAKAVRQEQGGTVRRGSCTSSVRLIRPLQIAYHTPSLSPMRGGGG
jgi:hypothetical protein